MENDRSVALNSLASKSFSSTDAETIQSYLDSLKEQGLVNNGKVVGVYEVMMQDWKQDRSGAFHVLYVPVDCRREPYWELGSSRFNSRSRRLSRVAFKSWFHKGARLVHASINVTPVTPLRWIKINIDSVTNIVNKVGSSDD